MQVFSHITRVFFCIAVATALGIVAPLPAAVQQVHPAVARIIVPERNGASLGSGTLVAVNDRYGLVVTNWHVVRDGNGHVIVAFPDGFHSGASVVKVDRDWDLAALVIWRPRVAPVQFAATVPRPGEPLTIAGYGKGNFRMSSGRCTQYVSPGGSLPFEMLELSTQARQGDSGGPILNQRGELAGVLFGASWGRTAGSHCGRVQKFLAPVVADFRDLPDSRTMIAARNASSAAKVAQNTPSPQSPAQASRTSPAPSQLGYAQTTPTQQPFSQPRMTAQAPAQKEDVGPGQRFQHPAVVGQPLYASSSQQTESQQRLPAAAIAPQTAGTTSAAADPYALQHANEQTPLNTVTTTIDTGPEPLDTLRWQDVAGDTWASRIKTLLAMIGIFAIFVQAVRLLGS